METSVIVEPPSQALVILGQYMQADILNGLPIYIIYVGVILLLLLALSALISGSEVAYFSMIFVFGGGGLGLAYLIEEKKAKAAN